MSKFLKPRSWISAAVLILILLPLSHPSFAMASTGTMYPKISLPANFNQHVDLIGSSLRTLQDEANPLSDRGFDAVKDEIEALNKFQEQTSNIMENLENICSENGRICDNMLSALESPSVRDEQHLERIRQMEAVLMKTDVWSFDFFSCIFASDSQQALGTTERRDLFLCSLQIGTDQAKASQDMFFDAATNDVDLAASSAPMESEIGSSKVAMGLNLRGGCGSRDTRQLQTGDILFSGVSFSPPSQLSVCS
jgi:hypothetical protein